MFSATSSSSSMPQSSYSSYDKLPRHHLHHQNNDNSYYIPLHTLNYFQCVILLYFFVFTVYYHDRYGGKVENVQVTSAVFDSNSKELTVIFLFDSSSKPRELYLGFGTSDAETLRNETQIELKPPPGFASNSQIFMWSSIETEKPESLTVNAEHPKSLLLRDHTGHPFLELSLQEPYSDFRDVVSCFSPISGDFEMVLTSLTSSIAMGSFVSIPYEELTGEFYKFLRIFEKSGNLLLTAFPLIRHPPRLDSTENFHLKMLKLKTDLSHLNCWLMHKNRAKFMIFQNSAEIVLPISSSLENPVYISEFATIFETPRVEGYGILEYNARITIDERLGDFTDFSIRQAMETARIEEINGNSRALIMKMHPPNSQNLSHRGKMYPFFKNFPSPPQLTYNFNDQETIEDSRRVTMEAIDLNWKPFMSIPHCAGPNPEPIVMNPLDRVKSNAERFVNYREALKIYVENLLEKSTSTYVLDFPDVETVRELFWQVEMRNQLMFEQMEKAFFTKIEEKYSKEVRQKMEEVSKEIIESDNFLSIYFNVIIDE